ncbi:MAG: ribonuclease M5 [bacterium]
MNYNEVIVVEGKNDQERISRLYPGSLIITTNGSEISKDTITTLITLSKDHDIILLLDPDYPGERIRHMIENHIPNCKHAFINKKDAISYNKKKVGVEHATDEVIIESLNSLLTKSNKNNHITYSMLISIGLAGDKKSSELRNAISNKLNIGNPNAKSFLNRINMLGLTYEQLIELMEVE